MRCGLSSGRKVGGATGHEAVCMGVIRAARPHDEAGCKEATQVALRP